tara:strand:- start:1001 stop:1270 length:270 start_codon:yes stop_codon:yes gene_type:complete
MKIKNASDLKYMHEYKNKDSHFFDRSSMRFFGDTMSNYVCSSKTVEINTYSDGIIVCYELRRKKPVKRGLQSSAFFCAENFNRILPKQD